MLKALKKLSLLTCIMALTLCFAMPQNAQGAEDFDGPLNWWQYEGEYPENFASILDEFEELSLAGQQAVLTSLLTQINNTKGAAKASLQLLYNALTTADAGTGGFAAGSNFMTHNKWSIYLSPYVSSLNNFEYEMNGSGMGVTAAASYRVNDSFAFGAHFDLGSFNFFADSLDAKNQVLSFAFGLHAAYNFTPEWYLLGTVTGVTSRSHSDFSDTNTFPHLATDSSFSSEAFYVSLDTGYTWEVAKGHTLTPEIGLAYLGMHTSAYDVAFPAAYSLHFEDSYYNSFYGNVNLDWRSEWEINDDSSFAFLAGVGLRQRLSANDMESSFRLVAPFSNLPLSSQSPEDPTVFSVNAGFEYNINMFTIGLGYNGGFGTQQANHGGNLTLRLDF